MSYTKENTGYYFIGSVNGINCTVCSQYDVNIDMSEVNQFDYLDIVNSNEEKYLVMIPLDQVTGYLMTGFDMMKSVVHTLNKKLTLRINLSKDVEGIEFLDLLPQTTHFSLEFIAQTRSTTYAQFTQRVNNEAICESKQTIMKLVSSKYLK